MRTRIKSVIARPDCTVEIEWADRSRSIVDFGPIIREGGVFSALSDRAFFVEKLAVGGGGDWLSWPGDLDFSADSLWYRSHPNEEIEELAALK